MEIHGAISPAVRPGYGPPLQTSMPPTARLSKARMQVLELLAAQTEPCTVAAVATALGQHTNTVREHLDGLVDARLARRLRAPAVGRGRPAWLYSSAVAPSQDAPGAVEYAALASVLADTIARTSPDPAAAAAAAGARWGATLVRDRAPGDDASREDADAPARRQVVALLDDLGFAPAADDDAVDVALRRCPLLAAAYRNPDVVCAVHLGLVRGALDALGAPTDGTALVPFAERGACRLRLAAPGPEVRDDGAPA